MSLDDSLCENEETIIFKFDSRMSKGHNAEAELYKAIMAGTAESVRPIAMPASAFIASLLPIMWSTETGSEVKKRIAAPIVGGMVTATVHSFIIIPILYQIRRSWQLNRVQKKEV